MTDGAAPLVTTVWLATLEATLLRTAYGVEVIGWRGLRTTALTRISR